MDMRASVRLLGVGFMVRTVVITGASGGIGSAVAGRFAGAGWRTALLYRTGREPAERQAARIAEGGGMAVALPCDVTDPAACGQALEQCAALLGAPEVLVNSAGLSLIRPIADTSYEQLMQLLAVNLGGTFNMTRAVLPYFLKKQAGAIVNISSMWGVTGASCEAAYSAAKAAVIGFTKASAQELAGSGITVICVAPGVIDTPMNAGLDLAALAAQTPLGRIGRPEEVAEAVFCLAGSRFITGQTLTVDGGFTL